MIVLTHKMDVWKGAQISLQAWISYPTDKNKIPFRFHGGQPGDKSPVQPVGDHTCKSDPGAFYRGDFRQRLNVFIGQLHTGFTIQPVAWNRRPPVVLSVFFVQLLRSGEKKVDAVTIFRLQTVQVRVFFAFDIGQVIIYLINAKTFRKKLRDVTLLGIIVPDHRGFFVPIDLIL